MTEPEASRVLRERRGQLRGQLALVEGGPGRRHAAATFVTS